MKVVTSDSVSLIYPYVHPDGKEESGLDTCIVVRPDKTLKLLWADAPIMTPAAARMLAEALLHAVEVAETGRE